MAPSIAPAAPAPTVGKAKQQQDTKAKGVQKKSAAPATGRGKGRRTSARGTEKRAAPAPSASTDTRRLRSSAVTPDAVGAAAAPPAPSAPAAAATPSAPAAPARPPAPTSDGASTRRKRAAALRRRRAARLRATRRATRGAARLQRLAELGADRLSNRPVAAVPIAETTRPAERRAERTAKRRDPKPESGSPVVRRVRDIVEVVPGPIKAALGLLALLSLLLLGGYLLAMLRARRLARQRAELLDEVGLLQSALLPPVPERIGAVRASVAYRPSDGPAAGGDFYDALALPNGCAGFLLGDVSGHGREALSHTAFMRYTLRAYLEAGLEPRLALRVAERVVGEHLGGSFATVILAVHDPRSGSLTYASAGHPPPIALGPDEPHQPIPAAGSPPIGWGLSTGLRQTTIPLAAGSRALLYTDGLEEAPTKEGGILGRERLSEIAAGCESATEVLERVALEAVETRDDMAACLIAPVEEVTAAAPRLEELELMGDEVDDELLKAFLGGCGIPPLEIERARAQCAGRLRAEGAALVTVGFEGSPHVQVSGARDERLDTASRTRLSSVGP